MPKKEDCGTLLSYHPSIRVLDATLRDGGLVNGFRFSDDFVRALARVGVEATVRASRAADIDAACGQLKQRLTRGR